MHIVCFPSTGMHDRQLLGINWDNRGFVDLALPFGLRSAPKIFTAFADVVAWMLHSQGLPFLLHYLDDFLGFSPPPPREAQVHLRITLATLANLNIPISASK